MRNAVLRVGGPMIFGGPLQCPVIGALIESTKLHLSDEIQEVQDNVLAGVDLCNQLLLHHGLPVVSYARTHFKFLACGPLSVAKKMAKVLKERGYLVNVASFPAVPMDKSGIRFTLHNWLRSEDIEGLVEAMATLMPKLLHEHGRTIEDIEALFKMKRKSATLELKRTRVTLESPANSRHWQTSGAGADHFEMAVVLYYEPKNNINNQDPAHSEEAPEIPVEKPVQFPEQNRVNETLKGCPFSLPKDTQLGPK